MPNKRISQAGRRSAVKRIKIDDRPDGITVSARGDGVEVVILHRNDEVTIVLDRDGAAQLVDRLRDAIDQIR